MRKTTNQYLHSFNALSYIWACSGLNILSFIYRESHVPLDLSSKFFSGLWFACFFDNQAKAFIFIAIGSLFLIAWFILANRLFYGLHLALSLFQHSFYKASLTFQFIFKDSSLPKPNVFLAFHSHLHRPFHKYYYL